MKIVAARPAYACLTLLCGCVMMAGCEYMLPEGFELGQHRVSVEQGNVLTEQSIRNLRVGMDTKQVLFLLGTPMVIDPFHPGRWEYPLFTEATDSDETVQLDLVSLHFKEGKLQKVRRLVPIDSEAAAIDEDSEIDTDAEWFDASDALVQVETPAGESLSPEAPAPESTVDEAIAEPEQTPRN